LIEQQRNYLLTVGQDEQISPQASAMCLKVFDLDKTKEGISANPSPSTSPSTSPGPSTNIAVPDCVQILRIFTNQFPEAKVMGIISSFNFHKPFLS